MSIIGEKNADNATMGFEENSTDFVLISNDGKRIRVSRDVALMSGMVQDTIGDDDDTSGTLLEVHVPCVSADILDLVVQYCTYFLVQEKMKAIPQPITSGEMGDMVQTWYANFCDTHHSILFDMIRASDYMGIKPLLDLVSAKVATLLFRKPPDEIRKGLGLVDGDFTPAEEKMVREENHWCDHLGFK